MNKKSCFELVQKKLKRIESINMAGKFTELIVKIPSGKKLKIVLKEKMVEIIDNGVTSNFSDIETFETRLNDYLTN